MMSDRVPLGIDHARWLPRIFRLAANVWPGSQISLRTHEVEITLSPEIEVVELMIGLGPLPGGIEETGRQIETWRFFLTEDMVVDVVHDVEENGRLVLRSIIFWDQCPYGGELVQVAHSNDGEKVLRRRWRHGIKMACPDAKQAEQVG